MAETTEQINDRYKTKTSSVYEEMLILLQKIEENTRK